MRIREENCNIVLLAAVTLSCTAVAGAAALIDIVPGSAPRAVANIRVADSAPTVQPVSTVDRSDVRVVGTPFVPNVNPRER